MSICAVCTHVYQMRNLPHIPNGLFTALLGPKLKIKMSQGMALGSLVRSCMFFSKCTQSELTNATQMTLPNKHLLVPCVRFTRVLPICRVANIDGAFTSYQSFLVNGSTLKNKLNFFSMLLKTPNGPFNVLEM